MAQITLEQVTKEFSGGVRAVDEVDLTIESGEFLVLVGPSGCGKSTLLRMIAGLEEVTGGRIEIGDREVTNLSPRDRDIAMVFQNYALYPHLTVERNLAYGLRVRKTPKSEIKRRGNEVAAMLGIEHLLQRRPPALSGGRPCAGAGRRPPGRAAPGAPEGRARSCATRRHPQGRSRCRTSTRSCVS